MIYYKVQAVAGIVMTIIIKVITMDKHIIPKIRVISPGRISAMPIDFMTSTVCIGKVILHSIKDVLSGYQSKFPPHISKDSQFCAMRDLLSETHRTSNHP
jgi:hypothetical protein